MNMPTLLGAAAFVIACVAWVVARRSARQVAELTAMYWQLKYDHGELKAKVDPAEPVAPAPQQSFVPLADIKRGASKPSSP